VIVNVAICVVKNCNAIVTMNFLQAGNVQHCRALFDDQLTWMYTRKVYLEYRDMYDKSTTVWIDVNPEVPHGYLVRHQKGGDDFCWANHAFRVHADVENGEYRCECRQWEHTGMAIWYLNTYNLNHCNRLYTVVVN
jgi:hypothetical protein